MLVSSTLTAYSEPDKSPACATLKFSLRAFIERLLPPSPAAATIPLCVLLARAIVIHTEQWWVTAVVAVGAALFGSFAGAGASYRANVALENRRRTALSEIRRKAKVYTPIREQLIALRRLIAQDNHLSYRGILRDEPYSQTMRPSPVLTIWRELVEDGRAATSASSKVRSALDRLEGIADEFNAVLAFAHGVFKERGDVLTAQTGFTPEIGNWSEAYVGSIYRRGMRESQAMERLVSVGPGRQVVAPPPLSAQAEKFIAAWDADPDVQHARERLREAEEALKQAVDLAIAALDEASINIAKKYEKEPED